MKQILMIGLLLVGSEGLAAVECRQVDQTAPVGTICITSSGDQFQRYENSGTGELGWQDLSTGGRIWLDIYAEHINQENAAQFCSDHGELPSKADFETGGRHKFREILKDFRGHWFWSSTPHPFHPRKGFAYGPSLGNYGWGTFPSNKYSFGSARCVSN